MYDPLLAAKFSTILSNSGHGYYYSKGLALQHFLVDQRHEIELILTVLEANQQSILNDNVLVKLQKHFWQNQLGRLEVPSLLKPTSP